MCTSYVFRPPALLHRRQVPLYRFDGNEPDDYIYMYKYDQIENRTAHGQERLMMMVGDIMGLLSWLVVWLVVW